MLMIAEMFLLAFFARMVYRKPVMQELADGYSTSQEADIHRKLCDASTMDRGSAGESRRNHRSYNATDDATPQACRSEGADSILFPDSD